MACATMHVQQQFRQQSQLQEVSLPQCGRIRRPCRRRPRAAHLGESGGYIGPQTARPAALAIALATSAAASSRAVSSSTSTTPSALTIPSWTSSSLSLHLQGMGPLPVRPRAWYRVWPRPKITVTTTASVKIQEPPAAPPAAPTKRMVRLRQCAWLFVKDAIMGFFMYMLVFKATFLIDSVVQRSPHLEIFTYMVLALIPHILMRSMRGRKDDTLSMIAESTRSVVLRHLLFSARWPLGRAAEALLWYLSVNLLALAPPASFEIEAPRHLRFLDPNGDGIFTADEIEELVAKLSTKLLLTLMATLLGLYMLGAKKPPKEGEKKSHVKSVLEVYWDAVRERRGGYVILDMGITIFVIGLITLQWMFLFGLNAATILTFGSVGGIAFGLAAQSLVGNFMSGMLILITRPFVVGDWIETDNAKGYVRSVRWNQTEIETVEGPIVIIPNNSLVGAQTANRTKGKIRSMEVCLPIIFAKGGFTKVPELLRGLEDHIFSLSLAQSRLIERPCAYFLGVDTSGDVPMPKVKVEVNLENDGLGEIDEVNSQVNIAVARYFQSKGCRVPGLEIK